MYRIKIQITNLNIPHQGPTIDRDFEVDGLDTDAFGILHTLLAAIEDLQREGA